jgi:hypothetical protein
MIKIIKSIFQEKSKKSKDPAEDFPKHVMEKILSYLGKDDILNCCLINKSWLKVIGKSEKCMKKIKFVVCEPKHRMVWQLTSEDIKNILGNGRRYQNIVLYVSRNLTTNHLLLVASYEWKTFSFRYHTFRSEIELINFFGLFEPFVEELDLKCIKTVFNRGTVISGGNFIFPRLKKLTISTTCSFVFFEIFKNLTSLEFLEIETEPLACEDSEDLVKRIKGIEIILLNNTNIKALNLHLHQSDFDGMFMDQRFLKRIIFDLETLRVSKFRKLEGKRTNIVQTMNFGHFLRSQRFTMTSLTIDDCLGHYVLEVILNDMDSLKTVVLGDLRSYEKLEDSIANVNFFKNESIENLSFKSQYSESCDLEKNLLSFVPNLKTLYIGTLDQKLLNVLAEKASKLLVLKVDYFTAYLPPETAVLRDLQKIIIRVDYASNFKDQLRGFSNYTNFEREFLKAVSVHDANQIY